MHARQMFHHQATYSLSPVGSHRSSRGWNDRAFPSQSAGGPLARHGSMHNGGPGRRGRGGDCFIPGRASSGRTGGALSLTASAQPPCWGQMFSEFALPRCDHHKMSESNEEREEAKEEVVGRGPCLALGLSFLMWKSDICRRESKMGESVMAICS